MIVRKKGKNELELELPEQNETLLHILTERLQEDKRVDTASYYIGHPELDNPILKIKTSSSTPKVVLKNVADSIAKDFAELRKIVEDF